MKVLMMAMCLITVSAFAKDANKAASVLKLSEARIFTPVKGSSATAGYAEIQNTSDKEVTFVISEASPFKAVETHETSEKDGRMAMKKIEKFIIPAKGSLTLKPGGNHIMLFEPSREIKVGEMLTVKYTANGEVQEAKFKVIPRMEDGAHHSGMGH